MLWNKITVYVPMNFQREAICGSWRHQNKYGFPKNHSSTVKTDGWYL